MIDSGRPANFAARVRASARDKSLRSKAGKFAVVGVINTGVDYGIFVFGYFVLGLGIVPANLMAWLLANAGSYVFNSFFTFAAESGRVLRVKDYLTFVASGVAGFVANTITVVVGSYVMPVLAAKVIAIGVSFLVNFALSHFVVFPARRAGVEGPQD